MTREMEISAPNREEEIVSAVPPDFQPFMRNVFRLATPENLERGLISQNESHIVRNTAQQVLAAFEFKKENPILFIARQTLYFLQDQHVTSQVGMIDLLQEKYAFPLTLEGFNRALEFADFVENVIARCRNYQELDTPDLLLIREEARTLKEKYEKETGLQPRYYTNALEVFEIAARLEAYGFVFPLKAVFDFNVEQWVIALKEKNQPEKARLLIQATRSTAIKIRQEERAQLQDISEEPKPTRQEKKRIYGMDTTPEYIDENCPYLHPAIARFIKNFLVFQEREWAGINQVPSDLNRLLVQDFANVIQGLLNRTDVEEQFKLLEEFTLQKYDCDGADPLLEYLINNLKMPLSDAVLERIHEYYEKKFRERIFLGLTSGQHLTVSDRFLIGKIIEDYTTAYEENHGHKPRGHYEAPEFIDIALILKNYGFDISSLARFAFDNKLYLIYRLRENGKLQEAQALEAALIRNYGTPFFKFPLEVF